MVKSSGYWYRCHCGRFLKSEAKVSGRGKMAIPLVRVWCSSCGLFSPWRQSVFYAIQAFPDPLDKARK
ncbi:hypothetical protein CPT_Saba_017 [Proteus phage Saba]|uniref:Uncharacterized protein n=1 Tax=Proteus phage Saba TaxID=2596672 RepID=A0A5B9NBM0_9CAUD|nr:hypothetical protein JT320_gp17 [Proteus phage Saba]QEG09390.1 hypothetical protein CPT_Saba_017 [Proteus phage Saba]